MGSSGKLLTSAGILDGTIQAADLAPGATLLALATATAPGGTASFSFSSIPQTYQHLLVVSSLASVATGASAPVQYLQWVIASINGDAVAATYYSQGSYVQAAGTVTTEILGTIPWVLVGLMANADTSPTGVMSSGTIWIPNYAVAKTHPIYAVGGVTSDQAGRGAAFFTTGLHHSAGAITSLLLQAYAGYNLVAGSTAALYGIP